MITFCVFWVVNSVVILYYTVVIWVRFLIFREHEPCVIKIRYQLAVTSVSDPDLDAYLENIKRAL